MTRFRANRLPRQPGPAGWNKLLPDPPPTTPLEADTTADVAIIGAGFAGLSAARRLVQLDPGLRIVVLEAGRVGEGPAGRNSGFMIDLPHDLASETYAGASTDGDQTEIGLNRTAIRFGAEAADEYGLGTDVFDPCGKINAACSDEGDRHNRDYAQHLAGMNETYRMMDADEMADLTGSTFYTSGLFTPGTVMLQPAAYIRGLAEGLRPSVRLCEESPVTEIRADSGTWILRTRTARVTAGRVILATNGHAASFGFFERQLMHVFTYASMTEPLPHGALAGAEKWGVTPSDPMGTTVRRIPSPDGPRIVVRSRFTYDPTMEVSDGALHRAGRLHDRKFADRFPGLSGIGMAYRWAGHLCLSRNGVPAHGELEAGIFSAVCQNGLGTTKGTLAGMAAAELAIARESDLTRAFASMDDPVRLPPEPLAYIGANAVLKWKEWRAGRE